MKKILLIVIFTLFIFSCGTPKVQKDFESMLDTLKIGNIEKIKNLNPNLELPDFDNANFLLEGYKKMTYKINSTKVNGNEAVINLDLKVPYLTPYFFEIFSELMELAFSNIDNLDNLNDEEVERMTSNFFYEKLNSNELIYLEKNINVYFFKEDNNWILDSDNNYDFNNMLMLGLLELSDFNLE